MLRNLNIYLCMLRNLNIYLCNVTMLLRQPIYNHHATAMYAWVCCRVLECSLVDCQPYAFMRGVHCSMLGDIWVDCWPHAYRLTCVRSMFSALGGRVVRVIHSILTATYVAVTIHSIGSTVDSCVSFKYM